MNRENAEKTMRKMLSAFAKSGRRPKVYLHTCCAPCASSSVERIHPLCHLTIVFYNPNIMPQEEYLRRKSELWRMITDNPDYADIKLIDLDYDNDNFLAMAKGREDEPEKGSRCKLCYRMRLLRTAELAKTDGADFFATTLTLSPHKSTDDINIIGRAIEKELSIPYLPTDFKRLKGYERSLELSTVLNLYRQSYCGCRLKNSL